MLFLEKWWKSFTGVTNHATFMFLLFHPLPIRWHRSLPLTHLSCFYPPPPKHFSLNLPLYFELYLPSLYSFFFRISLFLFQIYFAIFPPQLAFEMLKQPYPAWFSRGRCTGRHVHWAGRGCWAGPGPAANCPAPPAPLSPSGTRRSAPAAGGCARRRRVGAAPPRSAPPVPRLILHQTAPNDTYSTVVAEHRNVDLSWN